MDRDRGREFSVQPQPAINQQRPGHQADLGQLQPTGFYTLEKVMQDRLLDVSLLVILLLSVFCGHDLSDLLVW